MEFENTIQKTLAFNRDAPLSPYDIAQVIKVNSIPVKLAV
uniref:Uncharacterized protein n=1 Tax=uncultured Desulfobacterium sp. TaxID=201089 RepID=E1YK82_9BACT|nr:unknown protein [uncultured Desulfobacterium sp.]